MERTAAGNVRSMASTDGCVALLGVEPQQV
jgi:hypothetical protein